jgi:hypothetical protein
MLKKICSVTILMLLSTGLMLLSSGLVFAQQAVE